MARLPGWLGFLRPLVAKARVSALKALGLYELRNLVGTRGGITTAVDLLMVRLADRIGILESQVNWRLYGLPARVCNIKLEQAQLLAGSGDVEDALKKLSQIYETIPFEIPEAIFKNHKNENVFLFQGQASENAAVEKAMAGAQNLTIIEDEGELFYALNKTSQGINIKNVTQVHRLSVPANSALGRLGDAEFDRIWLSSVCERLTPIQIQIALTRSYQALVTGGVCAGYFVDYTLADPGQYWLDPRRLRPLTRAFLKAAANAAGFIKSEFINSPNRSDLFYFKFEK